MSFYRIKSHLRLHSFSLPEEEEDIGIPAVQKEIEEIEAELARTRWNYEPRTTRSTRKEQKWINFYTRMRCSGFRARYSRFTVKWDAVFWRRFIRQECLERELRLRDIPFRAQQELKLIYKDAPLKQTYKPDFICYGKIILELKAVKDVSPEHRAQVFNYLKATGLRLGLLVNFGHYPKATVERIIL